MGLFDDLFAGTTDDSLRALLGDEARAAAWQAEVHRRIMAELQQPAPPPPKPVKPLRIRGRKRARSA